MKSSFAYMTYNNLESPGLMRVEGYFLACPCSCLGDMDHLSTTSRRATGDVGEVGLEFVFVTEMGGGRLLPRDDFKKSIPFPNNSCSEVKVILSFSLHSVSLVKLPFECKIEPESVKPPKSLS